MADVSLSLGVVGAASAYAVWRRLLAYLRYFQQEGYEHVRFLRWATFRSITDPAAWLAIACSLLLTSYPSASFVLFTLLVVVIFVQPDPRHSGKIPLRLTQRARRILTVSFVMACGAWTVVAQAFVQFDLPEVLGSTAAILLATPLVLIAANAILGPYERYVQVRFEADARRRVADIRPFIIGITGSYGKSSSKAMLAHVLQFHGPTLAASGSTNTLMGLTRHIREELVWGHEYMVVEMGAFRTGSIRRLCELAPPSAGLITAVGDMHLERFGSTEEIIRAKSELAQGIPNSGLLVVNADSPGALRIAKEAGHAQVLLYGESSTDNVAVRIRGIEFSRQGTTFELHTNNGCHQCFTPLLGRPIIVNLTGVFTLAAAMGVPEEIIVAAMRTLQPVPNRLEVVEDAGITWIRDAYNSNQFGFRAALEVAVALPANRRFLVTPGVIELGRQQFDVNRALARDAATVCDNTIIVAEINRDAFIQGHRDAGREERLIVVASRLEAFRCIREAAKQGDLVAVENDLPDLYERTDGLFWPSSKHTETRFVKRP